LRAEQQAPRLATCRQVQERRAERVRIGRRVDDPGELLDRHVAERAERARSGGRALDVRGTKIDDRDRAVGAAEQVRRLDVAMDHHRRQRLQIDEHLEDLARDRHDLGLAVPVVGESRVEGIAGDQLLREVVADVDAGPFLEARDEARDRRVIERAQELRLALERRDHLERRRVNERELLERDLPAVGVARDVHAAVRARDQHALDDVATRRDRGTTGIAAGRGHRIAATRAERRGRRGVVEERLEASLLGNGGAELGIARECGFDRLWIVVLAHHVERELVAGERGHGFLSIARRSWTRVSHRIWRTR
jgi:hypothetical protein